MGIGDSDDVRYEPPHKWSEDVGMDWTKRAAAADRYYTVASLDRALNEKWREIVDSGGAEKRGWRLKWHGWVWAPNEPVAATTHNT